MTELWAWLDDEDGRSADVPRQVAGECARLAKSAGLIPAGVTRNLSLGERLIKSGGVAGLRKVYALAPYGGHSAASIAAELCASIVKCKPKVILLPATATGSEIAGRIAAELDYPLLSGCVDIEWQDNGLSVRREVYGQRAHQVLRPKGLPPWVVSLDVNSLHANDLLDETPVMEVLTTSTDAGEHEVPVDTWRLAVRDLDVSEAELVLSVGKGVDVEKVLPAVFKLAELLDGAVGGSREAVFANMIDRGRQVGASGKWISPKVYVALGISGSSYHLMGIKSAKHVAAINIDPNAPIFDRADWVGVADIEPVITAMVEACKHESADPVGDSR